jgi:single-strand DNA-binding protein
MEQLNRVELRGVVGSVRLQQIGNTKVANFTVATSLAYKDKSGCPIIETCWHNVTAWEGREVQDLELLERGSKVQVIGRIRNQRYTAADGTDHSAVDVLASKLALIQEDEPMQCQI